MIYNFFQFIAKVIIYFKFKLEVYGIENIPREGPVIIAANHTSNYDPILLIGLSSRKIHFLAKQELFKYRLLRWFFNQMNVIPVNRQSGMVIRPVRHSLHLIRNGNVYGIFPEGTRCKNGKRVKPKKGVGFFTYNTEAPILPIAITEVGRGFRQPVKVIIGPLADVREFNTTDYLKISEHIMGRIYRLDKVYLEEKNKTQFQTEPKI
ncbi:lysophospholipid acyltransferase family protein [Desertibacillus haloalkaliphilus]|uniref:lysophospholipid acyltransferase family protein n=1 Tax=Desertibacillus haloalkaliphilus TaxID=1328930 RepID=UPI001C25E51C|nr:lysophospholipid acyltransferase family protein [Desertibacillus haloalkaliphilus]MBU8908132.1 1-acyl-sn-glycerol-3-phosphate acyltransferase [Desertibacillus haloalkaliphilus]